MAGRFTDPLEWQYQLEYKCTPFEAYEEIKSHGVSHDEAFAFIQAQMDEIWKKYRARKEREAKQAEFHSVREEDTPFHWTQTEQEILENQYRIMEESPIRIPPDVIYEQVELSVS